MATTENLPMQLKRLPLGHLKSVGVALKTLREGGLKEVADVAELLEAVIEVHKKRGASETTYTKMCAWARTPQSWHKAGGAAADDTSAAPTSLLSQEEIGKQVEAQNAPLKELSAKFGIEPVEAHQFEADGVTPQPFDEREQAQAQKYYPAKRARFEDEAIADKYGNEGRAQKNREQYQKFREAQLRSHRELIALGKEDLNLQPKTIGEGKNVLFSSGSPFEGSWKPEEKAKREPRPPREGVTEPKPLSYLSIHVGGAGCGMGKAFWQKLNAEHGLGADGKVAGGGATMGLLSSCYAEESEGSYVPRAIFVDSDPSVSDVTSVAAFAEDSVIKGSKGDLGFWAYASRGYTSGDAGSGIAWEHFDDAVRKQAEAAGSLDSILLTHSCSGGFGSAAAHNILQSLSASMGKKRKLTLSLVEPWTGETFKRKAALNTLHALTGLQDYSDACMLVDNAALGKHAVDMGLAARGATPGHAELNVVTARLLANLTAPMRMAPCLSASQGTLRKSMSELVTSMVPYPRLKWLLPSLNPVVTGGTDGQAVSSGFRIASNPAAIRGGYQFSCFSNQRLATGSIEWFEISNAVLGRGVLHRDITKAISTVLTNRRVQFCDWSPTGFVNTFHKDPARALTGDPDVLYLSHTSAVGNLFSHLSSSLGDHYRNRGEDNDDNNNNNNNNNGYNNNNSNSQQDWQALEAAITDSGFQSACIPEDLESLAAFAVDYKEAVVVTASAPGSDDEEF
eukprot:TRINITY_DN21885_c0_g2_i1.p1 TRINITY_DN21885_c0_g2~~TRINITY_DN21885_c0_g2_i1.p1  ORF type:complete len:765 (-),score=131.05 TRINITY_DN21885_c0_g2_i1:277-2487(-)